MSDALTPLEREELEERTEDWNPVFRQRVLDATRAAQERGRDVEALLPFEDEPYRDRPDGDLTVGEYNVRAGWRLAREQVAAALIEKRSGAES